MTPEEQKQYDAYAYQQYLKKSQEPQKDLLEMAGDAASTTLKYAGKGLDYAGGLTRTALQQGVDAATGQDNASWSDALSGDAKTMGQYMEDAGVGEGAKLSQIPGLGGLEDTFADVSARGALGFAGDVALDPLTYLSAGLSAAAKAGKLAKTGDKAMDALKFGGRVLNKVLNPLETGSRSVSNAAYDKSVEKVSKQIARDTGKDHLAGAYSKLLKDRKFAGNAEGIENLVSEVSTEAGQKIGSYVDEAAKKGGKVSAMDAIYKSKDPNYKSFADQFDDWEKTFVSTLGPDADPEDIVVLNKLQNKVKSFMAAAGKFEGGDMPIKEAQKWRQKIANQIYKSPLDPSVADDMVKSLERGIATGIEDSVASKLPKSSLDDYLSQKKLYEMGTDKPLRRMSQWAGSAKELNAGLPTEFDAILGGAGLMHGGGVHLLPLAGKKLTKAGLSTRGLTTAGKVGSKIGNSTNGLWDSILRQSLVGGPGESE